MEFGEKFQQLRKQKNMTQEELAESLYVSRTAISKWESGRGYPNIDSLKEIAKFFSVSIDDLLSSNQLVNIAENENKLHLEHMRDLIFGLLDCLLAVFFFLPFFGEQIDGIIYEIPMLSLTRTYIYIMVPYIILVSSTILCGIVTLALQNYRGRFWVRYKYWISSILSVLCCLIFMMSMQPYAATLTFLFLIIKAVLLLKKP